MKEDAVKRVAVLFADGFEEVEGLTVVDFLRRAGVDTMIVGVSGGKVTGSHDIRIEADLTLEQLPADLDAIVLPGGMPGSKHLAESPDVIRRVRAMFDAGKLVASICAAPGVVLSKAGVLQGRRFTCYPGYEKNVEGGRFSEERVVVDGNLITSRAAGTAAEFSIALIRELAGADAAQKVHASTLQK